MKRKNADPGGIGRQELTNTLVRHNMTHMKTVTVRELRNEFPRIEAWVHDGESVSISKRGRVIAMLVPAHDTGRESDNRAKPDIMARLGKNWGKRVFSMAEVEAMRAAEVEGEEG
jgi:antitoxin (DNA-binding transcriptional repressor) of toxin-antitoxin stability system